MKDFQLLQDKIGKWADTTFSEATLEGLLNHLVEEAEDLRKSPYDVMSYADVVILLMVAARKINYDMEEIYKAVEAKHQTNVARIFLSPDEKGITRHKK